MRKILVLGCSGSGKSTFAVKLHNATGLPLFHLDNVWWRPSREGHYDHVELCVKKGVIK